MKIQQYPVSCYRNSFVYWTITGFLDFRQISHQEFPSILVSPWKNNANVIKVYRAYLFHYRFIRRFFLLLRDSPAPWAYITPFINPLIQDITKTYTPIIKIQASSTSNTQLTQTSQKQTTGRPPSTKQYEKRKS